MLSALQDKTAGHHSHPTPWPSLATSLPFPRDEVADTHTPHCGNRVCKPFLDKSIIVFMGDILIYSKNNQDHGKHLREVLEVLKKEKIYAKFSKCDF